MFIWSYPQLHSVNPAFLIQWTPPIIFATLRFYQDKIPPISEFAANRISTAAKRVLLLLQMGWVELLLMIETKRIDFCSSLSRSLWKMGFSFHFPLIFSMWPLIWREQVLCKHNLIIFTKCYCSHLVTQVWISSLECIACFADKYMWNMHHSLIGSTVLG